VRTPGAWARRNAGSLAVVGFAAALTLPWIIGASNEASLENRQATAMPKLTATSMLDHRTYVQMDRALRDRLGVRQPAIHMIAQAGYDTLGVSLSSRVYSGVDGYLFPSDEVTAPCKKPIDIDQAQADIAAIASGANGKPGAVTLIIAPDKSTIMRDKLGRLGEQLMVCADQQRARVDALTRLLPDTVFSLDRKVADIVDSTGTTPYTRGDTHWLPQVARSFGEVLIPHLASVTSSPDVRWQEPVVSGTVQYGDLYALLGASEPAVVAPRLEAQRPGATTTFKDETITGSRPSRTYRTTGVPTVPGRTLFIYDSFVAKRSFGNDFSAPQMVPYFESVTFVHWNDVRKYLAQHPAAFDRIVIDSVQRSDGDMFGWIHEPALQRGLHDVLARGAAGSR